jgi:hypothetical protein
MTQHACCRQLFGNPNPAASVHAWPMQLPELTVIPVHDHEEFLVSAD